LLVYYSYGRVSCSAWFMVSGAYLHLTGTRELFTNYSNTKSNIHVEIGTNAKCGVQGAGIVSFYLESRASLELKHVNYIWKLKMNFLSLSTMEDRGYTTNFKDG